MKVNTMINFLKKRRNKIIYKFSKLKLKLLKKLVPSLGGIVHSSGGRYCPICKTFSLKKFLPYYIPPVPPVELPPLDDWSCPVCHSHPRFRFMWLFLKSQYVNKSELSVLHFAPEHCLKILMDELFPVNYKTADIGAGKAMLQVDITNMDSIDDNSFDVVICSHVLEHVIDDLRALREIYRVLKKGGTGILVVPIKKGEVTIEDPNCNDPAERLRRFRQDDHFRLYGDDFYYRVKKAGFEVSLITSEDFIVSLDLRTLLGINNETIFIGTKRDN